MQNEPVQPSCITLRYGSKRYLLCADEVTNFLINCNNIGLHSPEQIANQVRLIAQHLQANRMPDEEEQSRSVRALEEIALSLEGAIFIDQ